jgi:hypothetical protein
MSPYQPGEPPSYAPPQDPWADVQGSATPTNPIPAVPTQPGGQLPQRAQYSPGVATPSARPPGIWSQETIASNDRYASSQRPGGAGLYVLVVILVLVLGGAGGYGAWYFMTQRVTNTPTAQSTHQPTITTSTQGGPTASPGVLLTTCPDGTGGFDACKVRITDCLSITGPTNDPTVAVADCSAAGSKKILKIVSGTEIGPQGLESRDDTYLKGLLNSKCQGLGANYYFAWDYPDIGGDRFFCMATQS